MKKNKIGTWICSYNLIYLDILIKSDFEWFTIDLEHSGLTMDQCLNLVLFIKSSSNKECYVRMSDLDKSSIKRVLDFGVDGIILPMVKDNNDLIDIIDSSFYPPLGSRGTGLFKAQEHGDNFENYIKKSYTETKIILQIEHIEAIKNLEIFLKNDHVYGLIIGPYDLSASLGSPGNFKSEDFIKSLKKFEELTLKSKKEMGFHLAEPNPIKLSDLIKSGYTFIGYSTDILLFKNKIDQINKDISSFV